MVGMVVAITCFMLGQGKVVSGQEQNYKMRLVHGTATDHFNHRTAEFFAKSLKDKTSGKVTVEIYPAFQLGDEKSISDAVALGKLDFAFCGIGEFTKRYRPVLIFDGPFIFKDRETLVRFFKSKVFEEINEDMAQKISVRIVSPTYFGTRHLTTSKVPVKSPKDAKGLKIRCPDQPMFISVVKAMGATPAPMAFPEVYLALQQGVIDGQENPAAHIFTNKFFEVQKHLTKTGHIIQGNHIFTNEKQLNKLPKEIKNAILQSGKEASDYANAQSFEMEDKLLKELAVKGMTIHEADHAAFFSAAKPLHTEYEEKWGKGLLERVQSVK